MAIRSKYSYVLLIMFLCYCYVIMLCYCYIMLLFIMTLCLLTEERYNANKNAKYLQYLIVKIKRHITSATPEGSQCDSGVRRLETRDNSGRNNERQ